MRIGVSLLLFVLAFGTSFSLIYYNLTCASTGIAILNGNYLAEDSYFVNGTTFVKCENQTIFTKIYGPKATNTSIFKYYGYNLTTHGKYLFILFNHIGNVSIGNYTIHFNGTDLLISNDHFHHSGLTQIIFSNNSFTMFNKTFPLSSSTINTTSFLSFSFDRIARYTLLGKKIYLRNLILLNNNTYILVSIPRHHINTSFFYFYLINSSTEPIDPFNIFPYISKNKCDNISYYELPRYHYVEYVPNYSLVFGVKNITFENLVALFNVSSLCETKYNWYTHINPNNPFQHIKYKLANNALWATSNTLLSIDSFLFKVLFNTNPKDTKIKLNHLNNFSICNNNTCFVGKLFVKSEFVLDSNISKYTFMHNVFYANLTDRISSKYFNLVFEPNTSVFTTCTGLNLSFVNNTLVINSSKNQVTCGICFNYSFLNQTNFTCKKINIDEPFIKINKNGTEYNYTITSKTLPSIWVYKNGKLIYSHTGRVGTFTGSGNLTVVYGNLAGNKTYKIVVQVHHRPKPPPSPLPSLPIAAPIEKSSPKQKHTKVLPKPKIENRVKLLNKTINETNLMPVIVPVTGNFIYIDKNPNMIVFAALFFVPLIIFLIFKYLPRIERRIIE